MLERVAVLSDIHGVLPALQAVLAEPDVRSADRIVLTGDIAAGPQPVDVLDALVELGERAVWVRGNADREIVQPSAPDSLAAWAADVVRPDQLALLAGLPLTVTLAVRGLGDVLFCHATPRGDEEVVVVDTRLDRWAEVLADVPPDVRIVVCGHTHMPFVRLAHGRLVVNSGSVGMPYGGSGAHWCLLGPGVELRVSGYDADAAADRIAAASSYPDAATWADHYVRTQATDSEALGMFGPRNGRR